MKHKTREDQRGEKTREEKRREEKRREEKRREEKRREEKREDKRREEARQEKREDEERERERWRNDDFFFQKNVSGHSNPPYELAQNVSKKIPFRTNYSSIFYAKVQNLTVFSFIYMIRIRYFGPGELIQNYFSGAQYTPPLQT